MRENSSDSPARSSPAIAHDGGCWLDDEVADTLRQMRDDGIQRAAVITADERRQMSREEHMRHFTTFVGTLLNDFGQYWLGAYTYVSDGGTGARTQVPI